MPSRSRDTTISTETVREFQKEAKVTVIPKYNRCRTGQMFILHIVVFFVFTWLHLGRTECLDFRLYAWRTLPYSVGDNF